eukprot:augustus_masked-scaffold_4-processed-gene-6.51-mRNA-1 protein AED:1.00 eAED:1.00 QI:0/-1/0/0/-1/1/1/0/640
MNYYYTAAVAVVISLTVFTLGVVQAVSEDLVVAKLATNDLGVASYEYEEVKEEIVIATLGVFTTTYDPVDLSQAQLEGSGLPAEKKQGDTIGFPLLFPAHSNLVADVLPLSTESLSGLGDLASTASALLGPALESVNELEFDSCSQYIEDADEAVTEVFSQVQSFLPALPQLLYGPLAETNLVEVLTDVSTRIITPETAPVGTLLFAFIGDAAFEAAGDGFCTPSLSTFSNLNDTEKLEEVLTNSEYTCLISGFNTFPQLSFVQAVYSALPAGCGDEALTVQECLFGKFSGALEVVDGEQFGDEATFQEQDFCTITSRCSTKAQYLATIGTLLSNSGVEELISYGEGILILARLYFGLVLSNNGVAVESVVISDVTDSLNRPLPDDLNGNYLPCNVVNTLLFQGLDTSCNYVDFLGYSTKLARNADNPATELLGQLEELYTACLFADLSMSECPQLFSALFLNGAFQNVLTVEQLILRARLQGVDVVYPQLEEACRDDETDKEILETAQVIFILGLVFYGASLLLGALGFLQIVPVELFLFVAGVLVFFGGLLNFVALLVARTAPIYSAVGEDDEIEVNDIFYVSGSIPSIALACFLLSILGSFTYFLSVYILYRKKTVETSQEEKDEDKDIVVEAKAQI